MCELYYGDYECSAIWNDKQLKARKHHTCGECEATIEPRERYWKTSSLFDGAWADLKTCGACMVTRAEFTRAHGMGPPLGELRHFLKECIADGGSPRWGVALEKLDARGLAQ